MDENKDIRTIDELIDLPYSEMTDEEIELVVNFKASVIAREEEYKQRMQMLHDQMQEKIEIHREAANRSSEQLNRLTKLALDRFEKASNE